MNAVNIKWKQGVTAPVGYVGHTAVWLNGLVHVGGGYGHGWEGSYRIDCYDPVIDTWSSISTSYCYFAMTTLNHRLLIAGGKDKSDKRTSQILTMDGGQLKNYAQMNIARSFATAVGHHGMLIITGGYNDMDKTLSCTDLFDSNSGQWYSCNDLPQPHSSLKSVIVDNILYLLGGRNNRDGNPSTAVFTASLDTLSKHELKWSACMDTPWCWSAPVSIQGGTHLLIVGGSSKTGEKHTCSSDIYKFNKVSHNWEAVGCIPSMRRSSAAVSTADNEIFIVGGLNGKAEYTNTVWIGSCEPQ